MGLSIMARKSAHEEDWKLPLDQQGEPCLSPAASEGPTNISKSSERIGSNGDGRATDLLGDSPIEQRSAAVSTQSGGTSGLQTGKAPRVFLDSNRDLPHWAQTTECLRRTEVEDESNDQYHDSELDIFDLYNVCNGVVRDGFLDIRKLDELSQEELEVFNIVRLRDIWSHSASGCPKCEAIIETLNSIRASSQDK